MIVFDVFIIGVSLGSEGRAIAGEESALLRIRRELAGLSALTGTGCAWFHIEQGGVRCLLRHLIPEAVGIIQEGALRDDLRGHGSAVAACAFSETVATWHAATLRSQLQVNAQAWRARLHRIRKQGFDLSFALEGVPGQPLRASETLARLSVPIIDDNGSIFVLTATGHGLSPERIFPSDTIALAQAAAQRIARLWHDAAGSIA